MQKSMLAAIMQHVTRHSSFDRLAYFIGYWDTAMSMLMVSLQVFQLFHLVVQLKEVN